jgi:hypothetical protein
MNEIKQICQTWHTYQKEVTGFTSGPHAYDISYFIEQVRKLATFLKINLPILHKWTHDYFQANKTAIFIRFWRDHLHKYAMGSTELHPQANEWDTFFHEPSMLTTVETVKHVWALRPILNCDDPKILAIHEGKEHNGPFGCDHCEDQEYYWDLELQRRLKQSDNPLLNPTLPFDPVTTVLPDWTLPYIFPYSNKKYYNLEEYLEELCQIRVRERIKMGRTVREHITNFIWNSFTQWCMNIWDYQNAKTEYDFFFLLWNILPIVPSVITMDLPWIDKIEQMDLSDKSTIIKRELLDKEYMEQLNDRFLKKGEELFNTMCLNLKDMLELKHFDIFDITNFQNYNSSALKETDAHLILPLLSAWLQEEIKGLIDHVLWRPFRCNYNDMYYAYKKLFRYKHYYFQLIIDTDGEAEEKCDFLVKCTDYNMQHSTKYDANYSSKYDTQCSNCGNVHHIHFSLMMRGWRDNQLLPGKKLVEDPEEHYWSLSKV